MKYRHGFLILALCLSALPVGADDSPYWNGSAIVLPRLDMPDQVGKFQDIQLTFTPQNTLAVGRFSELSRTPAMGRYIPITVNMVEVVKSSGVLPISVYLRAKGFYNGCGFSGSARAQQRLVGNNFDVTISLLLAMDPSTLICTANIQTYTITIPLQVYGLSAGSYTYSVNGVAGTLSLDAKNKFADDCDIVVEGPGSCG